ncbi:MAG: MFS transporter [Rhodospirillaceae bacterium]|nr:MFS transporter [Rhodospirillaceae bacterium]
MLHADAIAEFKRGWRALVASAVGNGSGLSGIPFYTFGVFVLPLATAFDWSRGQVSTAASFLILGTAITAPIIGTVIDKLGARRVGIASMLLLSVGYVLLTQINANIAVFYAAWLLMSLVGGGTTPVVWTRTVNIWFDKGRGLALGVALAGSGLAGVIAPVLTTKAILAFGWQGGYLAISAFIVFVAVPVLFLFFQERKLPAASHAADTPALTTGSHGLAGLTLAESRTSTAFWKIAIGFFFVSAVIAALIINLVPLLIDRGLPQVEAAKVASIMGTAVLIGRVGIGYLLDRFSAPKVARLLLGLSAIGCLMLSVQGTPQWVVALSVISLGFAAAAEVDLLAFLTSRFFGMKSYGKIYGLQLTAFYLGASLGPLCAGLAYDAFGNYLPTLYFAALSLLFGAVVIGTLGKAPDFGGGH